MLTVLLRGVTVCADCMATRSDSVADCMATRNDSVC